MGAEGAKVIPLRDTREVDVVARKTPGHPDLRDQAGTLFIDCWLDGTVYKVQFDPFYEKLQGAIVDALEFEEGPTRLVVVDADDNKRWTFEVNDLDYFEG